MGVLMSEIALQRGVGGLKILALLGAQDGMEAY